MKSTLYIRVPPELKEKIEKKALEMGISVNALVILILNDKTKNKK